MPTYSYACTSCDNRFDVVQSFADPSLTVCEQCQGRLRKVFDSVGVVFKGSGFYRTDARGSGGSSEPAKDSKDSAKPSGDGAGGSSGSTTPSDPASSGASAPAAAS